MGVEQGSQEGSIGEISGLGAEVCIGALRHVQCVAQLPFRTQGTDLCRGGKFIPIFSKITYNLAGYLEMPNAQCRN